ncbi:flagellar biosynthetic protein FliO [Modicisalibacter coralii]|uniref:flagellar biosynthetic protein FliO n=1 Tax=Modicisalibacter coralii TaxID=2304602 RepID=UPI00100C13D4|nr:flagellar biosynthetic protein FliO [Halomonas coralii]
MSETAATQGAAETLGGSPSDLMGLAMLGKTVLALLVVIGVILLCSYLLRRLNAGRGQAGQHLKVVGSAAVGQKERVVIVEVQDTWLVLGVGGGQVNALHRMEAPDEPPRPTSANTDPQGFASRFAAALRQNTRDTLSRRSSDDSPDRKGES